MVAALNPLREDRAVTDPTLPLQAFLGLQVVRRGSPSRLEMPLTDEVRGAVAPLHGGALTTLVDVACGFAAAAGLITRCGCRPAG